MRSATLKFALLLAATPAFAQAPRKLQALIVTGQNTASHDWRATTPVLRKLLEDTGRFDVRVTEEFRGATTATLEPYDLVVLSYYDGRKPELRWGETSEQALLTYAGGAKGLLIYHFALAAFDGWTNYEKLCSGNWRPDHGHHSARHDFPVTIRDTGHPITRGMKPTFVQINDELYANLIWQPQNMFHVLATAWDEHKLYKPGEKQPIPGDGLDQPVLWTTRWGNGRIVVTALGHDAEAMKSPAFIATFTRGAEWAASGQVTIPLPPELR